MKSHPTSAECVSAHILATPELLVMAERCIRQNYSLTAAAREFVEIMTSNLSQPTTGDGGKFTQKAFKLAMRNSKVEPGSALV